MKTHVAVPLVVALLAGMLLAGGCVSRKEYDDLAAANRRAQDELKVAQESLQALRAENSRLVSQLEAANAALAAANQKIALLEGRVAELQKQLQDALAHAGTVQEGPPPALPEDLLGPLRELVKLIPGAVLDEERGVIRLSSDMTFEKGSDVVLPAPKKSLEQFAKIMQMPAAQPFYVYVAGHTDDIPISRGETKRRHPNNWYLSVHRAVSVEEVLSGAGMPANRIGAMGYGENYPIVPNAAGHKGNPTNRRVELWIVPASKFLVLPMANQTTTPTEKVPGELGNTKPKAAAPAPATEPSEETDK